MRVVVCGGAGYIGSHTVVALLDRGHTVSVVDNFSNSSPRVLDRLGTIAHHEPCDEVDVRDVAAMRYVLERRRTDAVIHFAALKSVPESCAEPLRYFGNNVSGTIALLQAMQDTGVKHLVFSSSATVYGTPERSPVTEDAPLRVTNPYGRSKLVMEQIIADVVAADPTFHAAVLRYFNPVGAHPSGQIGESPLGVPANLMPAVCQAAVGRLGVLSVYGKDYPTRDGTGVRDFIHVMDLADAHADALQYLANEGASITVNLGTGRGTSVLEFIRMMERIAGRRIPVEFAPRRPGDVAEVYADPSRAHAALGWRATRQLFEMCADAWRWQSMNPYGYADPPPQVEQMEAGRVAPGDALTDATETASVSASPA
jgi:UDP-glucose 4-epimerase